MLRIQSILIPTDFSACSETAYAVAEIVQRQFDAALHILHLVETPVYEMSDVRTAHDAGSKPSDLREHFTEWIGKGTPSSPEPVSPPVAALKPADSVLDGILGYVDDHDIDLVVIGTHGRKGTERFLLGSVAERVVRLAPCPVLTVRRLTEETYSRGLKRILVAVDFSEPTGKVLEHGCAIAARWDAELDLTFVIEIPRVPGFFHVDDFRANLPRIAADALGELEKLRDQAATFGVAIRTQVLTGDPSERIVDYAGRQNCDLIVLATSGSTGMRRFVLGSVAEQVVRTAPCPVFTLKSEGKSLVSLSE